MRGYITYVSKEPINQKPHYFSTGGYEGTTKDGIRIMFDWNESKGNVTIREDGFIEIEAQVSDFELEFLEAYDSNNQHIINPTIPITPEYFTNLDLIEVSYECWLDEKQQDFINLSLKEFIIMDAEREKTYYFKNLDKTNEIITQDDVIKEKHRPALESLK